MANLKKFTKAACGHMFKHYERAKEFDPDSGQLEYVKFANQQIDTRRSHLNYNLAAHQTMRQGDFIRKRCSEVKLQNRKDVNVMCSWVLTVPKDLPETEQADFFKHSYEFMADRYGHENVISAYVHLDETSPHIHFSFIPVTADKKKGGYKVSAKEAITKHELQVFHQELSEYVEKALGHSVGILNGETKDGNRSIAELKEQNALKRIKIAELGASEAEEKLSKISKELSKKEKSLSALSKELSEKKLDQIDTTPQRFVGGFKGLSPQQAQELLNTAKASKKENKVLKKELAEERAKNDRLVADLNAEKAKNQKEIRKTIGQLVDLENQNRLLKRTIGISGVNYDDVSRELRQRGLQPAKASKELE